MTDVLSLAPDRVAAMVGVIGLIGGLGMGVPKHKMITGVEPARPEAVKAQIWLGVLCGVFVGVCVKSFIDSRIARTTGGPGPSA